MKCQGMLEDVDTKEKVAHSSYTDIEGLDFQILLTYNYYVNPKSIHICFPMEIKNASNVESNIDDDLITVNNFFAHLIKEISITEYGSHKELTPTPPVPYKIYHYSDALTVTYSPMKFINILALC